MRIASRSPVWWTAGTQELTLAVVGIDFANAAGSNWRSEAIMTLPGDSIELLPDPKNKRDPNAIAVISPNGVQLGYVNAERAPYINSRMNRGEDVVAIFQGMDSGCVLIRIRFGGCTPTLPLLLAKPREMSRPHQIIRRSRPYDPHVSQSEEDGPEWGA